MENGRTNSEHCCPAGGAWTNIPTAVQTFCVTNELVTVGMHHAEWTQTLLFVFYPTAETFTAHWTLLTVFFTVTYDHL